MNSFFALRLLPVCSLFFSAGLPLAGLNAEDSRPPVSPALVRNGQAVQEAPGLPPYDFKIQDGLYATVTALSSFEAPQIRNDSKLKLSKISGFKKDLEVRVLWQSKPAPVVIPLLGLATRFRDPLARLWQAQLYEAGFHVLTFDSIFLPSIGDRSRHGVAGNLVEEAKLAASVVEAFLKSSEAKGRVTKAGFIGCSYGGTLALNLAQQCQAGKLALTPAAVLVFSPPVSLRTSARLLDKFHEEDRWKYKLVDLAGDLKGHKPVASGVPVPFEPSEMRAGIAAVFRMDLTEVVNDNDERYKMKRLPQATTYDKQYRKDVAETWTFTRFIEEMSFPYWSKKGSLQSVDQMWDAGEMIPLLKNAPEYVHVVLAADDPFNDPQELQQLKSAVRPAVLTVLPNGGHMGYVGTAWSKARLARLFE